MNYAPNSYLAWEKAQVLVKHNRKLDEIKNQKSNIDNHLSGHYLNPVSKRYGRSSFISLKSREVKQENLHLLEKIVSIHQKTQKLESKY